jgi:hypothetical protein
VKFITYLFIRAYITQSISMINTIPSVCFRSPTSPHIRTGEQQVRDVILIAWSLRSEGIITIGFFGLSCMYTICKEAIFDWITPSGIAFWIFIATYQKRGAIIGLISIRLDIWWNIYIFNDYQIVYCNYQLKRPTKSPKSYLCKVFLKVYRLSELNFFAYIKSCQYSMFYTNKMFWTRSQV